jgi:hypothetical protein
MALGAVTNALAETVDAPPGAIAVKIPSCSLTMRRLPRANALTLTATALNMTRQEACCITLSFEGTVVLERADRVSDY